MLALTSHNDEHLSDGIYSFLAPDTPAERRSVRMSAGAGAWIADVAASGGCRRGVGLLLLTFDTDPSAGRYHNAIRRFWDLYRKRWGNLRYFAWLELQRSGRYHYHALIVDPPPPWQGHDYRTIRTMWGEGLAWIKWRGKGWFNAKAAKYAVGYAKKIGAKSYQQDYANVPSTLRTFTCNRLRTGTGRMARLPKWARKALSRACLVPTDAKRPRRGGGWAITCSSGDSGQGRTIEAHVKAIIYEDRRLRQFYPPGKRPLTMLGYELTTPNLPAWA